MKLIHFLWDDNTEPAKRFDDSARKMNPGADVILWRFGDVKKLMVGSLAHLSPIYNSMPFLLQRANLLRLVLVEQFGGIYLDMDMECCCVEKMVK
jgi:mannosyltransferase OCH1-like enzyme